MPCLCQSQLLNLVRSLAVCHGLRCMTHTTLVIFMCMALYIQFWDQSTYSNVRCNYIITSSLRQLSVINATQIANTTCFLQTHPKTMRKISKFHNDKSAYCPAACLIPDSKKVIACHKRWTRQSLLMGLKVTLSVFSKSGVMIMVNMSLNTGVYYLKI